MSHPVLIADVGGTSSRLALVGTDPAPVDIRIYRNENFAGFEALIAHDVAARNAEVKAAVLAIAGPADGERVKLTNRDWGFARSELRAAFGWQELVVQNDFEALARGVPALTGADLIAVGGGAPVPEAPVLVCGPGTGFGVAGLIREGGRLTVVTGEGGLCRLGATNAEEARLLAHLVRALGPVAVEHALSGAGLARMHAIFSGDRLTSEQVIAAALAGREDALETCRCFLRIFGRIAGDLALLFGARGGVYLAGGVSAGLAPLIHDSPFREAFEEHPPHEARLAATPVSIITHPTPGLFGAGQIGAEVARRLG
ncbi:glucokinase [Ancylobacter terrae]|uniref:glucokinase n=1 Tax=Ancylobacter sp. sgz301288 TaxID=3342077 RepID=UPI00385A93D8